MKIGIKCFCCLFFFCFSFSCAFAQNENFSKNIKLYYNLEYTDWSRDYPERFQQILHKSGSNFEIGHFSPAISFSKGRFFQELELSKLKFREKEDITDNEFIGQNIIERVSGTFENTLDIALRYEAGIFLFKKNEFFNPIFAFSIQPYFTYGEIHPRTTLNVPVSFRKTGAVIEFAPHLQFQVSERLMIDLMPALTVLNFINFFERTSHPGVIYEKSIFTKNYFDFLPKRFGIRLGVGYKI